MNVLTIPVPPDAHAIYRRYLGAVVLHSLTQADAIGLHPTDLYALNVLELDGPMTAGALAQQTGLSSGATTRLIDRLEQRGHVRRVPDPSDRRRVTIEVVPNPTAEAGEVFDPARRLVGEVFSRFSADQLKTLFDYFEQAAVAYQQATRETRRP